MKNKLLKIVKGIVAAALLVTTIAQNAVGLQAAGTTQYFWLSLYDSESKRFSYSVIEDTTQNPDENKYSKLDSTASYFFVDYEPFSTTGIIEAALERKTNKGTTYSYTFPGTITNGVAIGATAEDREMAKEVASALTSNLNNALSTIARYYGFSLSELTNDQFFTLAVSIVNSAGNKTSGTVKLDGVEYSWSFRSTTKDEMPYITTTGVAKGTTIADYVSLDIKGETVGKFRFSHPKGYLEGQKLSSKLAKDPDLST